MVPSVDRRRPVGNERSRIGACIHVRSQKRYPVLTRNIEPGRYLSANKPLYRLHSRLARALAQRSADAAKEIKEPISGTAKRVSSGVTLVNQASAALSEIIAGIESVANSISSVSNASKEQAVGKASGNAGSPDWLDF